MPGRAISRRSKPPTAVDAFVAGIPAGTALARLAFPAIDARNRPRLPARRSPQSACRPIARIAVRPREPGPSQSRERSEIPDAQPFETRYTRARTARRCLALRIPARRRSRQLFARSAGRAPPRSARWSARRRARQLHPRTQRTLAAGSRTPRFPASSTKRSNCRSTGVLARMEHTGIRIDTSELARLSALMETGIARLTSEIHALAGREFNICLAAAAGQSAVRGTGPARAGAIRQRQDHLDRSRCSGSPRRRSTKSSARCSNTGS